MGKINWGRVILGGLLAGVLINASEYVLNGIVLGQAWADAIRALGKTPQPGQGMGFFILWGFLAGIVAVWIYAGIRPRFGPGPKTAAVAGLMLWVAAYVLASIVWLAFDLFPARLTYMQIVWGLPEAVLATVLGAWLYKE